MHFDSLTKSGNGCILNVSNEDRRTAMKKYNVVVAGTILGTYTDRIEAEQRLVHPQYFLYI